MNCRKVNHLLSAYIDGELPGVEHRQIHEHIIRCGDCGSEYDSLLQTKRLLGCLREKSVPTDIESKIRHAIAWEQTQTVNRSPLTWIRRFDEQLRLTIISPQGAVMGTGLAAIALLLLGSSISTVRNNSERSEIVWTPSPISSTLVTMTRDNQRFVQPPGYPAQRMNGRLIGDLIRGDRQSQSPAGRFNSEPVSTPVVYSLPSGNH